MPVLSRFYGIIIRMYFLQSEHNPPHIHAIYNDDVAAIDYMTGEVLEGYLPPKALAMVREWIALHKDTLQEIWETQEFKSKEVSSMFHKVKSVSPLPNYKLSVGFSEGIVKLYDIKPLFEKIPAFTYLKEHPEEFACVSVDVGGYGIIWGDELDLSCDELWEHGEQVNTPFDGLMSFGDASELWGLSESTLRKAVSYGKLVNGVDVCKFGKQWVVSKAAMKRAYGETKR